MGIFDRITKKVTAPAKPEKAEEKKKETAVVTNPVAGGSSSLILFSPRVSEKAAMLASKGTYVFNVPVWTNKSEVCKAVEALYKVNVAEVRTARGIGKRMARGRIRGRRQNWKKALVTLKKGQTINLHEGV